MTYSITLELHEAVINDDKVIADLVRKEIDTQKEKANNYSKVFNNMFGFQTDENGHLTF